MCDYFIGFRSRDKITKGYCIKNRPLIRIVHLRDKCKDFSFNINDLKNNNAIPIDSRKKRTRYTYDIQKFVNESHL